MTCFIPANTDLRGFCSHLKQFVGLISAHKNGLENTRELCDDMPFNDLSTNIVDERFHGNLKRLILDQNNIAVRKGRPTL